MTPRTIRPGGIIEPVTDKSPRGCRSRRHPRALSHRSFVRPTWPSTASDRRRTVHFMCRNITTLRGLEPSATPDEIEAAARQYIRKVSGVQKTSDATEAAFERAVALVAAATRELLVDLPPRKVPPKTEPPLRRLARSAPPCLTFRNGVAHHRLAPGCIVTRCRILPSTTSSSSVAVRRVVRSRTG